MSRSSKVVADGKRKKADKARTKAVEDVLNGALLNSADRLSLQLINANCTFDQLREIVKDIQDDFGLNLSKVEDATAKQGINVNFRIPVILKGRDATAFISTLIGNVIKGKIPKTSIYNNI